MKCGYCNKEIFIEFPPKDPPNTIKMFGNRRVHTECADKDYCCGGVWSSSKTKDVEAKEGKQQTKCKFCDKAFKDGEECISSMAHNFYHEHCWEKWVD